jgi:HAD superfamily hydrolase (TIGR01490 family)
MGLVSQETFYQAWGSTMSWMVRGWTPDQAQAVFEQLTEEHILPNLRADIVPLLQQHRDQGHEVALVSGTSAPWLDLVARKVGVPRAIGTPLESQDGRYTGRILPPLCQGPGKPVRAREYFARESLVVDWAGSYAYADSGTDLPLFAQVGHPVAVYPDEILLSRARTEGWPVIGGAGG